MTSSRREKERRRRLKTTHQVRLLKDRPCADCGGVFPPYVMHFDHREPGEKLDKVSSIKRIAKALREAAKCDVVCANCHAIRTHEANHYELRHPGQEQATDKQGTLFH